MPASVQIYAKPVTLWRYRPVSRLAAGEQPERDRLREETRAIRRHFVWCSPYRRMNDPMEGLYERQETRFENATVANALARQMLDEKTGLGIASFSESWDNELMWAHYADGFQGICIGYNFVSLLDGLPDGTSMTRVVYADRPRGLRLRETSDMSQRAKAVLSTKSARWNYEREWRLFAPTHGPVGYGPGVITKVLLGTRTSQEDEARIRDRLANVAKVRIMRIVVDGYRIGRR